MSATGRQAACAGAETGRAEHRTWLLSAFRAHARSQLGRRDWPGAAWKNSSSSYEASKSPSENVGNIRRNRPYFSAISASSAFLSIALGCGLCRAGFSVPLWFFPFSGAPPQIARLTHLWRPKSIWPPTGQSCRNGQGAHAPRSPFSFVSFVLLVVTIPAVLAHNSRLVRKAGGSLPDFTVAKERVVARTWYHSLFLAGESRHTERTGIPGKGVPACRRQGWRRHTSADR